MKHFLNGLAGWVLKHIWTVGFLTIVFLFGRIGFPDFFIFSAVGIVLLILLLFSVIWEMFVASRTLDDKIEIIHEDKNQQGE